MSPPLQVPPIDPIAIRLGPIAIRWYGVAYLIGFGLGYLGLRQLSQRGVLRLSTRSLGDLLFWVVIGVVVGGRLGWWLIYDRETGTGESWYEPFAIWHGGMSFHGGLVGVAFVLALWSHWHGSSFWNLADCVALVAPPGLFFGRLANFINAELVGRPTTVPWAIIFPGDTIERHPSQLYEAILEGPILLITLWGLKPLLIGREGTIASLFLCLYGTLRLVAEFFRQPDEQIGFIAFDWITMGQLLSFLVTIVGALFLVSRLNTADKSRIQS